MLAGKKIVFLPLFLKKRAGFGAEPHKKPPGGEAPLQYSRAAKRRCNIRGQERYKGKIYISRNRVRLHGINLTVQTQRKT